VRIAIFAVIAVALSGCRSVVSESDAGSTTRPASATTITPAPVFPTTAPPTSVPPTGPAPTTTTTRPPSRAEATTGLCAAVAEGDARVQRDSYISGALRLSGGISTYEKAADPAVVTAARTMLSTGVKGDAAGYVTARTAASAACARAGTPIHVGGPIVCVAAPCP